VIQKTNSDAVELSISIVNYNTTDSILNLIDSIKDNFKNIIYEILVVDNASEDDSDRITKKYKDVKLIRNSTNLYFTKADNQNFLRAEGQYILSINPDTLVSPNALENMIDFLKNHQNVGAVTPRFIYPDGRLQASISPFLTLRFGLLEASGFNKWCANNKTKLSGAPKTIHYNPDISQEREVLYGACIMVRRAVLETVGLKDEKLVHGWDEYDWCKRIKNAGWKLYYVPNSVIVHYRSESMGKIKSDSRKIKEIRRYSRYGFFYLYKKHFGYAVYIFLKTVWCLSLPYRLASRLLAMFSHCRSKT
jgi:hypothetical protein